MAYADDITITSTHKHECSKEIHTTIPTYSFCLDKTKQPHTKSRQNNLHSVHTRPCRIYEQSGPNNKQRAINIIRSITVSNYTYNGKNIWYLFLYINDELKMYAKFFILLLIYLLKHIIYQYCQFYLPTLGKLFLNIYFQTENTRTYIIIVYFIHYTCLTIILCTCGMALLFYACIVYVECACLMSVYIVEPEASIGSERRRCFPLQTMFSYVWGCDISATFSCVIYIYMKHKHVLIFFHTTRLCKQK